MLNRRDLLLRTSALMACSAVPATAAPAPRRDIVHRRGMRMIRGGEPWRYVGTNMWYAAYAGADAPYGNRARLQRELDRLAALGVQSVRVLGSSEQSPLLHSVTPTFRDRTGRYNETLLRGLDFTLAEMGKRGHVMQ